jgi:Transposase DDE domain group 1
LLSAASAPQDDLQKPRILTILLALENVTLVAKWRSFLSAIWHSFGDLGFGKRLVGRPRRPPFAANAVRLQLHALAYNLGNFLRTLATPEPIKDWSLTSLKEKLIKICAKVVSHGRYRPLCRRARPEAARGVLRREPNPAHRRGAPTNSSRARTTWTL